MEEINLLAYYDVFDRYYGMCDSKLRFMSHTALHKQYYTCIQKFITFIIIFTSSQRDIRCVKIGQRYRIASPNRERGSLSAVRRELREAGICELRAGRGGSIRSVAVPG